MTKMIHQLAAAALFTTGNITSVAGGAFAPGSYLQGGFVPSSTSTSTQSSIRSQRVPSSYKSSRNQSLKKAHRDDPIGTEQEKQGEKSRSQSHTSPLFRSSKSSASALHAYPSFDEAGSQPSLSVSPPQTQQAAAPIAPTAPTPMLKGPKEAYDAFADKGMQNAKKSNTQIMHQAILGGAYVGFAGLLSLIVAGNLPGVAQANPGLVKMAFAALFPCNLLFITTTGGQLFTGNSATVAAARYEKKVTDREFTNSLAVSLLGNVIGCGALALAASYTGLLTGGAASLCSSMATTKCLSSSILQIFVKAVLCNWMVSLALFLSGAASDLTGKLVGIWFPISTFVAIGLEHSIANLFLLPSALLLQVPGLNLVNVVFRNLIPAVLGNAVGGAIVVAGSYSYQFGRLGKFHRNRFSARLKKYEERKEQEKMLVQHLELAEASYRLPSASH